MIISGIFAMNVEINSFKNTLSTGSVDIEINEYDKNGNSFSENNSVVKLGDKINLITKVHNLGMDCYIRLKLIYKIDNNELDENYYVNGDYKLWNKTGDYYYYNSVLENNGTVQLFNELTIPTNSSYLGKKISLNIVVEAIQAANFDNNWDEVTIKKSINRDYNINFNGNSMQIYQNDTYGQIKLSDSFFNDLENMVPGDTKSEIITIYNDSSDDNEYFLDINYDNLISDEINLLKKINVVIKKENGELIVSNDLTKIKDISLGKYKSGEKDKLIISLYLPKNVDNEYSKLLLNVIFRFYIKNIEDSFNNPTTGDSGINIYIIIFILSTFGFLTTIYVEKKNMNNMKVKEKGSEFNEKK